MTAVAVAFCAVLGLIIGSFLNVVIWRVPRGESIQHPGSHCPRCEAPVKPYDNVPVLSWVLLRAKCRHCGQSISVRYPLVEITTGALFAGMAARIGIHAALPGFLYLAAIAVALSLIDVDTKKLPNVIVLPSYGIALLALTAAGFAGHQEHRLIRALIGMAIYYGVFFLIAFIYPKGMGFGDVKLAGILGLFLGWLGWSELAVGSFAGILLGGVTGVVLLLAGSAGRKTKIPFGPFMFAGALLAVFVGAQIAHEYLHTFTSS